MDAVEFLKEWKRMCDENGGCENCAMYNGKCCISGLPTHMVRKEEEIVKNVENWSKAHPAIILTEQQKTAIRGRIAEGWDWVARDFSVRGEKHGYLRFYTHKPNINERGKEFLTKLDTQSENAISCLYKFVTFENSPLYLPDLLGGEE